LNFETGAIDLILSDAFLSNIDLKLDESQVQTSIDTRLAGYQAKLISNSTDGRNLLRPDGITMLAIQEDQFIKITPMFSLINNIPTNFRLVIGLTNEFAHEVLDATSNIATLQTQIANIPSPFWVTGKVNGLSTLNVLTSKGRYGFTCTRPATFPNGVYYIAFNTAYENANYVINTTNQATGTCKVWDYTPPTNQGFHIVTYNTDNAVSNSIFHFSVIA
jgi:hypothetical protein